VISGEKPDKAGMNILRVFIKNTVAYFDNTLAFPRFELYTSHGNENTSPVLGSWREVLSPALPALHYVDQAHIQLLFATPR